MRIGTIRGALLLASALAPPALAQGPLEPDQARGVGVVALKAGTIHLVEDGRVLANGTILVRNGKILAAGSDVAVPPHAEVFDYGPDAVIVPGLVAPFSNIATGAPSPRTASPGTRAVDSFDPYQENAHSLRGGVTSAYLAPSETRLISGVGAMVKLAGDDGAARILNDRASIHGAIDALARNTPGYWEPPVPATVDTGMPPASSQLPRSTMGAIVGLTELVTAARGNEPGAGEEQYGEEAVRDLRALLAAGVTLRISAVEEHEIRALLDFAAAQKLSLVIEKALDAAELADEIAAGGHAVVFRVPYQPNSGSRDYGKGRDDHWPRFDVPAALARAGVRFAISGSSPRDLLFFAALATRGGLDPAAALRAITLTPAELCGAADRIGSIRPGKDGDFCVLNTAPFDGYASVLATWVDGKRVWSAHASDATVLEVEELHVGDGTVLRPGQVLLADGDIVEVGERVSHPVGAQVVRGKACMPGMIDALGHLGLEGTRNVPGTDFKLRSILSPADDVDRRVAGEGITTVVLTPRGSSRSGAPMMAYKPSVESVEEMLVGDPVALRVSWKSQNRLEAGAAVRELLAKGAEYRQKWIDYEKELAAWTPPPPEPPKESAKKEEEKPEGEKAGEEKTEEKPENEKKSKKKKGEEELEPDPITGFWSADVEGGQLTLRLHLEPGEGSGDVTGNLRCSVLSDDLVEVEGSWCREDKALELTGLGSTGWIGLQAKLEEKKLAGKASSGGLEVEFSAERVSKEHEVAGRSERRKEKVEETPEPKGKPRAPRVDDKLEPVRRALDGRIAIVVEVDREDEILACVAAFEEHGIEPVLYGAEDAHHVARELAGRVRGILLAPSVLVFDARRGTDYRTPYVELQNAGIAVAFTSEAEEGTIDLPLRAAYAVANGMSPSGAVRALTADAARMMSIDGRVGRLAAGLDGDVLLLDGPPLAPGTSVLRTWVAGKEVRP